VLDFVTLYDNQYRELGFEASRLMAEYTTRHLGTGLSTFNYRIDKDRPASWNKILAVREVMETSRADWVVWFDCDTVVVNTSKDPSVLLQDVPSDAEMIISSDNYGLCCGVFGMRNSAWSKQFLDALYFLGPINRNHPQPDKWEQDSVKILHSHFRSVSTKIHLLSQDVIQNPDSKFCPDAWMMHYWTGGRNHEKLIELMRMARAKWSFEAFDAANYRHV